ncbi:MAG: ABC transporter ATP-binding protein [Desulfobacterales bacterium]|nr:ABC transporter ATP-binding protein [Desulfobacterales bacterium]
MLRINNLKFGYDPAVPILNGISFNIPSGGLCALFGPNGCGKTTLFRCCLKQVKPQKGTVYINGGNIHTFSIKEMARQVAYVPQEHQSPFPYLVKDMVLMGRNPHTSSFFGIRAGDREKAWEALCLMGIADMAERPCNQLSGGERQLVLIARAIAQEARVMFLNEPTAALDFSNQIRIWRLIKRISRKGITVLACTHNPNHVTWFCDQVVVMHQGTLIAQGPPGDVIREPVLDAIYRGMCEVTDLDGIPMVTPKDLKA